MIVSNALKTAFTGLQLTYFEYLDEVTKGSQVTKDVQFFWGDQKELNKWVAGRQGVEKYPLIWYVKPPYQKPRSKKYFEVQARLILFTSTKQSYYNNTRSLINYNEILNPLYNLVEDKLKSINYIEIVSEVININDEPNFGVDTDRQGVNSDFSSTTSKGTKSITLDYLDAKVFDLKLRVYPIKCNN